jgi:hypothetical protein
VNTVFCSAKTVLVGCSAIFTRPDILAAIGAVSGPAGATGVAEAIIGLPELDHHSYLRANRNWSPREQWNTLGKLVTVAQPALPAL